MSLGLDYSGGRPGGAAIAAAGYGFVLRYLDNGLGGRANLTVGEVADLESHDIEIGLVWESQANRASAGFAAGQTDAAHAASSAAAAGRAGQPIYFVVDFDIPDYDPSAPGALGKLGPVGAYFGGVLSVLPLEHVGVYGGYWAVKRVLDAGLAEWAWQTMAWSGGNVDPRIHLLQRVGTVYIGGVACDVNEQRQADFGQNVGGTVNPDDLISPDGLTNADGSQKTDKVKNFLGYADEFARQGKDNTDAILIAVQALTAKVDALAADVAALKSAAAPDFSGDYDAVLTRKTQQG